MGEAREKDNPLRLLLVATLCVAAAIILRNAWMADDAYITLRSVDHFCSGRGMTYNPGQRVQVFTHPLWMLCMSVIYFVTREHYFSFIALSVLTSLSVLYLFARRHAGSIPIACALILVLVSTRAFVDYSTSGLENPLTHLLLVLFFGAFLIDEAGTAKPSLPRLTLLASLLTLNRMDSILLVLPALLASLIRAFRDGASFRQLAPKLLLASSPFLLWELFSLFYFGSLVPNTALAKLGTGVPRGELVAQGGLYFVDALERDPLTLVVLSLGILGAFFASDRRLRLVAWGMVLSIFYIVVIGGDFMSGRFLTPALMVSCIVLARAVPDGRSAAGIVAVGALALGLLAPRPTFLIETEERTGVELKGTRGVADEQAFWYPSSGLLTASRTRDLPESKHRRAGEESTPHKAAEVGAAGFRGFFAPPDVYLVDHNALVDAFLARLPASTKNWRPGHFRRKIPEGYPRTLISGKIRLKNKRLVPLYRDVHHVISGPLWSMKRFGAIWRLHFHAY